MHSHNVLAGYLRRSRKPTLDQLALGATAQFIAAQRKKALKEDKSKTELPPMLVRPSSFLVVAPKVLTSTSSNSLADSEEALVPTNTPTQSDSNAAAAKTPKSNKGLIIGGAVLLATLIGGGMFLATRKKSEL